jgi:hypothetical protein
MSSARIRFEESLAVRERLAGADPSSAILQRDLIVSLVNVHAATGEKAHVERALTLALALQEQGRLAPRDAWMVEDLRKRAAAEQQGVGQEEGNNQ